MKHGRNRLNRVSFTRLLAIRGDEKPRNRRVCYRQRRLQGAKTGKPLLTKGPYIRPLLTKGPYIRKGL